MALLLAGFWIGGTYSFITMPTPLRAALALAPLVGVLAVASVVGAVFAWYANYWSQRARIHQTVLAVLGLLFVWQLLQFGFV